MKIKLMLVGVVLTQMVMPAFAIHRQPPKTNPWLGTNAVAGITLNTGDTVSQNINTGLTVIYNPSKWHNEFDITYVRATNKHKMTDRKLDVKVIPSYYFHPNTNVYFTGEYQNFLNDGYDYVYTEVLGMGHDIYHTDKFTWHVYGGPGMTQFKVQDDPTAKRQNKFNMQYGTLVSWQVSKSTNLNEQFEINDKRTYVLSQSITKLTMQINSKLSAQLQYTLNHNSKPGDGKHKFNSTTQFNLVFNLFK